MATFEEALKITLEIEGGYVNNPQDKGEETYKGISRHYHPDWTGWKIIDKNKIYGGFPGLLAGMSDLQDDVKWLYRHEYWNKIKGDDIKSQRIANKFFDACVNPGLIAIKFMQRSLNDALTTRDRLQVPFFGVSVDGIVGKQTLDAINSVGDDEILPVFKGRLVDYYNTNGDPEYIEGWLARAKRG